MTLGQFAGRPSFPLRVAQYPDEPAHALLLRTAARNGTSLYSSVFRRSGIKFGRSVQLVDVDLVAHLCRADSAALHRSSARRSPTHVDLLGQSLRNEHMGGWFRRWCPQCLSDEPYHRVWWDISYLTSCPIHGVELATRCDCDEPLVHGRQAATHCRRNHDLRQVTTVTVDHAELVAERYILARLQGSQDHPVDILDAVPLGNAMHVMERLGRAALAEDLDVEKARKVVGIRKLMASGFDTIAAFPAGLDRLLDGLVATREDAGMRSLEGAYGTLYPWLVSRLKESPDCPLVGAIKQRLEIHARANVISPNRMVVAGRASEGLLATEVAERCGLSGQTFLRLAETLGFAMQMPKKGRPGLVAAGDVDAVVDRITGLWPMARVKASLGLSLARVIELADRGWLPYVCRPYARTEPKGKRGDRPALPLRYRPANTWYFEPEAVPAFMQSLATMVRPDASRARDLVDLMSATRMFTSTVSVIELVLAGKLPIRGLDPARPGLRGFLVSKSEAGQLLKAERREGHPLRAAAPLMGMNYNQLRSCVNARLVATTGSGTAISITEEAIADFKATYVRATELAATFGVKDSRLVIRYLREHGITPLETDAELGMTIYLRAVAGPAAESLPPPVRFASSRERARYQREKGLAVQATRKSYEVSPDWNKRGSDRSGSRSRN